MKDYATKKEDILHRPISQIILFQNRLNELLIVKDLFIAKAGSTDENSPDAYPDSRNCRY